MISVIMLAAASENQPLDLALCVIRHLSSLEDKILRDHTIGVPLTGLDLRAQQTYEKRGFFGRGRKPGPSG
jgi:hypothetical protein